MRHPLARRRALPDPAPCLRARDRSAAGDRLLQVRRRGPRRGMVRESNLGLFIFFFSSFFFFLTIATHGPCWGLHTERHAPPFLTLVAVFACLFLLWCHHSNRCPFSAPGPRSCRPSAAGCSRRSGGRCCTTSRSRPSRWSLRRSRTTTSSPWPSCGRSSGRSGTEHLSRRHLPCCPLFHA